MKEYLNSKGFSFVEFEDNDPDTHSGTYKLLREDVCIIIYHLSNEHWKIHMFREDRNVSIEADFYEGLTPEQFNNLLAAANVKL